MDYKISISSIRSAYSKMKATMHLNHNSCYKKEGRKKMKTENWRTSSYFQTEELRPIWRTNNSKLSSVLQKSRKEHQRRQLV